MFFWFLQSPQCAKQSHDHAIINRFYGVVVVAAAAAMLLLVNILGEINASTVFCT